VRSVLLLAALLAAALLHAAPDGRQTTTVQGAPPSLAGRWLATAHLTLGQRTRNMVTFWDVARDGDGLVVTERFFELPADDRAAIERADAANAAWTPSPETLAALSREWDRLPDRDVGLQSLRHEIIPADAFDEKLRAEPTAKDALWVVRQRYTFEPGAGTSAQQENLWAGVAAARNGYRVNVRSVTIASGPIPLPLTLVGPGTLYRLDDPPPDTLLQRLLDVFRGCGRTD